MIVLDTNVLARYVLRDHSTLSQAALQLIRENDCYISRIVLLELHHVLESVYRMPRATLLLVMQSVTSLERMTIEDEQNTVRAIEWFEAGMDFADALVLSSARGRSSVATFDRDFAKIARKLKTRPEVLYRG